jgi:hypothetical protein
MVGRRREHLRPAPEKGAHRTNHGVRYISPYRFFPGSPDTQLTPQALANMTDEQFAAIVNELMAKGDRQKLMDLDH